ncbi:polysaccharide biosynthesis protein [Marinicella rhabdoformis]|uniref:polysaccharide biosynthesis protein n=1 Tax=Marinicella rhabdoformis TaxID=2580566 RepID=UPI0012AECEA9|nr:nucleoside-diphosphate sugar epimerase/dehydratase [Marinicella rhabdoformis]
MLNRLFHLRLAVVAHDLFMVWLAWVLGFVVRYSFLPESRDIELWSFDIACLLAIQAVVSYFFNMYRGLWRFASVPDLMNLMKSAVLGALSIAVFFFLWNRLDGIPRSVLVLYPIFLVILWGGPRITYRIWKDRHFKISAIDKPRVLLIGAGNLADLFIRNAASNGSCHVMAIIDDTAKLKGAQLRGVKIRHDLSQVGQLITDMSLDIVVIAKSQPSSELIRLVVDQVAGSHCQIRITPDPEDFDAQLVNVSQLKPITVEDLLGRDKVELDWKPVADFVKNKSVLVTGGGGSIGSELCRQLTRFGVSQLTIVDHAEYNLYAIDKELSASGTVVKSLLGNVVNKAHLFHVFKQVKPDVVFHAAAYKHVPLLESHASEAFLNNVVGTQHVADCCDEFKVDKMVLISTDKAVNPYSVMGATKRLAEKYCQFKNQISNTDYLVVRFGNVLGSAGSVVPLFEQQIAQGGPVTVTHKDMERYFMTIPEACQLILQGLVLGEKNSILVLDMGKPIKIKSLAERMIALAGKAGQVDISFTGLRQGEKLNEELHYDVEQLAHTPVDKIHVAKYQTDQKAGLVTAINQAQKLALAFEQDALKKALKAMVPEFKTSPELAVVKAEIKDIIKEQS